jgi:hypothetical protein
MESQGYPSPVTCMSLQAWGPLSLRHPIPSPSTHLALVGLGAEALLEFGRVEVRGNVLVLHLALSLSRKGRGASGDATTTPSWTKQWPRMRLRAPLLNNLTKKLVPRQTDKGA